MIRVVIITVITCIIATVVVRHGPLEPNGTGERIAILLVWLIGVLCVKARILGEQATPPMKPGEVIGDAGQQVASCVTQVRCPLAADPFALECCTAADTLKAAAPRALKAPA